MSDKFSDTWVAQGNHWLLYQIFLVFERASSENVWGRFSFFWGGGGRHWILNHYINAEHISKYGFLRTHSNLVSVGLSFFEFADHLLKVLVFQEFPCCLSRTYINGIGTTEMQRIYEVESCFFGKINKADNSFAKLTKKKRRSEMIRLELKRKHYKGLRTLGKSYTHTLKHLSH